MFPNLHPWYEQSWAEAHQKPASGVQFVQANLDKFFDAGTTGGRVVALHESWWPSDSTGATGSYAGDETAKRFCKVSHFRRQYPFINVSPH